VLSEPLWRTGTSLFVENAAVALVRSGTSLHEGEPTPDTDLSHIFGARKKKILRPRTDW